mmetsp:Transcript_19846/g.31693  ORF Transcript_19846/g.31693 Transcript_19846/m.31693 type:complete len:109 (+) Transcript_19846:202-528(+)
MLVATGFKREPSKGGGEVAGPTTGCTELIVLDPGNGVDVAVVAVVPVSEQGIASELRQGIEEYAPKPQKRQHSLPSALQPSPPLAHASSNITAPYAELTQLEVPWPQS